MCLEGNNESHSSISTEVMELFFCLFEGEPCKAECLMHLEFPFFSYLGKHLLLIVVI